AGGIGLRLAGVPLSRPASTGLYLGMGWAVFLCYFELVRVLSQRAVRPALVGGLVYSVGAVLRGCSKRPVFLERGDGKETIPHRSHGRAMGRPTAPLTRRQAGRTAPQDRPAGRRQRPAVFEPHRLPVAHVAA